MDLTGKSIVGGSFVGTIGFFDGVHLGHRYLLNQVKEEAKRLNLPSAVVTFPVHPRKVLQKDYQPALLCRYEEKIEQLQTTGIDYCITLPFTTDIAEMTAQEFMQQVLKQDIGIHTLIVGYDHRFGHNREDGFQEYVKYGNELGMNVIEARELQIDGENVSSTKIRRLLKNGEIEKANSLLTYNYTLSGKIVEGYRVGRTIGFPTANIKSWERYKVIPKLGVYAVLVHIRDIIYEGMLYIGTRPTLHDDPEISVEVNIFNFNADLYDQSLTVEFIDFIREDKKFDRMEELIDQIHNDKSLVLQRLKNM
ncbi:MAG TPA: bifunctional riboflavin kinase/FAD synthetase [Fermentimonas caenicola]|uniref:bifunctional riboflavin kinase/FAD synthetase n=1 Tax=Lascolabacillus sp. TaxID=1924068 RepID=UPI0011F8592E|nr:MULTISPECIES: bifunctional riboflavin kinase/FAD synthetase [Lascolabacillus]MBP6175897.1 bifunctional riboflavin kinase/FAD synthetase [Fermentimonas sp.]MDI9626072.1 bifunctional riboflavin kinase/FAD synthetase [Bacteroidota bacterium]TAH62653.1 MAG: bifunctional riboflavin kinase/FAD synthetase [Fermentimonas caenicola]MBP6196429.1 bifunctional riboflavin kinase/FAD synthetase [Fermentimonas sp.]MBP7104456.1 bifunctional riboflavin kinase/FAD synthetase [Fermentimonas sp.]